MRILNWSFVVFLTLCGLVQVLLGGFLVTLGGSFYYLLCGAVVLCIVRLYVKGSPWAVRLFGILLGLTLVWGLFESDGAFLSLLPRMAMWMVAALWFLLPGAGFGSYRPGESTPWVGVPLAASAIALLVLLMQGYSHWGTGTVRSAVPQAATKTTTRDWRHYGNTNAGTRFAEVDQITVANVGQLREAWRFRTGVKHDFKATPLQVDGSLYFCAAGNVIISLDDASGEEQWRYDPEPEIPGKHQYARTCRGVSYYESPGAVGECAKRIITGTVDARLIAVDALTGKLCGDFGNAGQVDLRVGLSPHLPSQYYISSPPLVAGDLLVVGGLVMDSQRLGLPSGVVRAYHAVTGEFTWAWDVGRPGDNGMPAEGDYFTPGTPNVWTTMSYDAELGLIYAPTGNAAPDYYGGERRAFDDEYSSAIVALDATSGAERWKYQTVHHDVWDYDLPAQPTLVEVEKNGELIPSVAVPTKRGEVFLLDRRNGDPVHPIEERSVPQNPVDGDYLAKTQPFSSLPHFHEQLQGKDMWGLTPIDQLLCRVEFKMMRNEGDFTPPSPEGTFLQPGNFGGYNWGGVSVDADHGLMVVAPMLLAHRVIQVTPEQVADAGPMAAALLGRYHPAINWEGVDESEKPPADYQAHDLEGDYDYRKIPYYSLIMPFMSRLALPLVGKANIPCFEPPWSRLAVIDLNRNELLWSRPIGSMKSAGPFGIRSGIPYDVGVAVRAGTLTTRGGLTFVSSTMDSSVRAFNVRTGEKLWTHDLPGNGQATPMSYVSGKDGRQYLIVTVPNPSWVYPRDPSTNTYEDSRSIDDGNGGYVIAYALEQE